MNGSNKIVGVVKKWTDRGYGFLSRPDGPDVFAHNSAFPLADVPPVGTAVTYEIIETSANGKARARQVMRA
jgi:cold shock CspA family protein